MPPLLDFATLQNKPLREVATLPGLDHPGLRMVLEAAMPGVRYSRNTGRAGGEEHSVVDPASGSAVRIVITWNRSQARSCTCIAEIGTRHLWTELVACLGEWERHGRTIPQHWQDVVQLRISPEVGLYAGTAHAPVWPERVTARACISPDGFVLPLEAAR